MTAPPEVPHIATRYLNLEDHPFLLYLREDNHGGWEWVMDISPALAADKARCRDAILALNQFTTAFYVTHHMGGHNG